jgi:anti-anti-sigma factor
MNLTSTFDPTASSAGLHVDGDLDYATAADFVDAVSQLIAEQPTLRSLHLDFTDLTFCDSAGLSALLAVHRRTSAAGARLHLDNRPLHLERILQITGVLDHLTATPAPQADAHDETVG